MQERLRIGVIGCGLIAQVMHLHYLRELADRFEITALCDVSEELVGACAKDYGVARTFSRWQDLLASPVDAVLILTSGSHAPIAIAAAEAGKHMLIESRCAFRWPKAGR
jgi:predicted dehydrogenase